MKYVYDAQEKKQFQPVLFPIDHSFKHYMEWKGYQEEADIAKAERKYGKNLYVISMYYNFRFIYTKYKDLKVSSLAE